MGLSANDIKNIRIDDLYYYFDGKERDRLDAGGLGHKQSSYLAMREKLLRLPTPQFDAAMQAIQSLVGTPTATDATSENRDARKGALELFEAASAGMKAKASEKVSRI